MPFTRLLSGTFGPKISETEFGQISYFTPSAGQNVRGQNDQGKTFMTKRHGQNVRGQNDQGKTFMTKRHGQNVRGQNDQGKTFMTKRHGQNVRGQNVLHSFLCRHGHRIVLP